MFDEITQNIRRKIYLCTTLITSDDKMVNCILCEKIIVSCEFIILSLSFSAKYLNTYLQVNQDGIAVTAIFLVSMLNTGIYRNLITLKLYRKKKEEEKLSVICTLYPFESVALV